MRQHLTSRALGGAIALLLLSSTPIAGQLTHAVPGSRKVGRISGDVRDEKGEPVASARITITTTSNTKFRKELATGKDGTFATFLNNATLTYHYRFEKPGYVAVEQDKKVPIWNPNDVLTLGQRSADLSVLNIRLVAEARAARDGK